MISAINIFLRACAIGAEDPLGAMQDACGEKQRTALKTLMTRTPLISASLQ